MAQAQSTIAIDDALVAAAQTQLDFTTIRAPFDGDRRPPADRRQGNVVHPTDATGLVVVTQVQPITAVFPLPSADIAAVYAALKRGSVTALAYAADDRTELDRGTLLLINNVADPTTGTVQLKAQFPNAQRSLWPGTFVNVHVVVDVRKGRASPCRSPPSSRARTAATSTSIGGDAVARMRPVTVGQSRDATSSWSTPG